MTGAVAVLDREHICRLIPHTGTMCLLDAVAAWDSHTLTARASSHRDPRNPLRRHHQLAATNLIEYAAQAMAVHGGLLARAGGTTARAGLLVGIRDVQLAVTRIDDIEADLQVQVTLLLGGARGWLYSFVANADRRQLATGRIAILPATAPHAPDGQRAATRNFGDRKAATRE